MSPQDQPAFRHTMLALATAFDRELDMPKLEVYFQALQDLPFEAVKIGIERAIQEDVFWPSPGRLRALQGGHTVSSVEDEAELAWRRLRCLFGSRAYNADALEEPLTRKIFWSMGGPQKFGAWDYEREEAWKRREFKEFYSALARREPQTTGLNRAEAQQLLHQLDLRPKTL